MYIQNAASTYKNPFDRMLKTNTVHIRDSQLMDAMNGIDKSPLKGRQSNDTNDKIARKTSVFTSFNRMTLGKLHESCMCLSA